MYKTGLSSYLKEDVLSACFRLWNILMQWDYYTPPPPSLSVFRRQADHYCRVKFNFLIFLLLQPESAEEFISIAGVN